MSRHTYAPSRRTVLQLGASALAGAMAGNALHPRPAVAAPVVGANSHTEPPGDSGYATVPGGKVWWKRMGSGPKTPLLLLHGGPGAAHNYLHSLNIPMEGV